MIHIIRTYGKFRQNGNAKKEAKIHWVWLRKRMSDLAIISIETSKTEKEREQRLGEKRIEHPRTVGQLKKV